jgi:protein SCO1/2
MQLIKKYKTTLIFFALTFVLGGGAYSIWAWNNSKADLPYYGKKKIYARNLKAAQSKGIQPINQFEFINQDAQPLGIDFVKGKVWVGNYFFTTCPTVCPEMTHNLEAVQAEFLGNDQLKMISFSCNPEYDTPERLLQFATAFGAVADSWQFVTGDKTEIYRFARNQLAITASDGGGGPEDFIHSQYLVLVDQQGYIRGFYDGTSKYEVQLLIKDIKKLLPASQA